MSTSEGDPAGPHVVHERDVTAEVDGSPDGTFAVRRKRLASAAGGRQLGCGLIEVPPGTRPWPYHFHWGNEEAMYVLSGSGTLRLADREVPIAAGDYVAFPIGPDGAHQVRNTSAAPLRCLMLSTMVHPDITVYPDSNKIGVYAGSAPGGAPEERRLNLYLPASAYVDYFEGEVEPDV